MIFGAGIGIVWQWLIGALVLMVLELLLPGVFLLWFGISALITGAVAFIAPDNFALQFTVFACFSVINIVLANKFMKKTENEEKSTLNRRAEQYIGKKCEFKDGKVKVGDTWWLAVSDDQLRNTDKVEVIGADGNTLKVKKI